MSKKFFGKAFLALVFVAAAVLWLLSEVQPETFGFFNLSWAVAMVAVSGGAFLILRALLFKGNTVIEKTQVYFGAALLLVGFAAITFAVTIPKNIIWPIVAIIITGAIFLALLSTGGKKWDQGDNQNIGYKNYHQRKAEEEKAKAKLKD